jgi:mercuric transport protein
MKRNEPENPERKPSWGLFGAVGSAIAASVCCLGPLVLLALGVSGAWITHLTRLEPYRPIFAAMALIFLGFAFYSVYRRPKAESCPVEKPCAHPGAKRKYRTTLWIALVLILGLLIFPYAVPYVFAGSQGEKPQTEKVRLEIKNMSCFACTVTVKKSLTQLEGVKEVKVTVTPPEAVVIFDPAKVKVEDIIRATANAGYPSSIKQKGSQ